MRFYALIFPLLAKHIHIYSQSHQVFYIHFLVVHLEQHQLKNYNTKHHKHNINYPDK